MTKPQITKKDIGNTVEFTGAGNKTLTGTLVTLRRGVATITHKVGGGEYTATVEKKNITAVHRLIGFTIEASQLAAHAAL